MMTEKNKIDFREEIARCVCEQYRDLAKEVLCINKWEDLKNKVEKYELFLDVLSNSTKLIRKMEKNGKPKSK